MSKPFFAPIDDGPHSYSNLPADAAPLMVERHKLVDILARAKGIPNPLAPQCVACSLAHTARLGMPANVAAERALVLRDLSLNIYRMVVHCHGQTQLVDFGAETPTEHRIRTTRVFDGPRATSGRRRATTPAVQEFATARDPVAHPRRATGDGVPVRKRRG